MNPLRCSSEPIDALPEQVAEVVLRAKPKKVWRYEEETGRSKRRTKTRLSVPQEDSRAKT